MSAKSPIHDFLHGIRYLGKGALLIVQPKLRHYAIIPLIINILLFSLALYTASHYIGLIVHQLTAFLPSWLSWLSWLIWLIFGGISLIIIYYCFAACAMVISAPFSSLLAEVVEYQLSGEYPPSQRENWTGLVKDIPRTLKREFQKLCYFLPRTLVLFVCCFIPLVQLIAPFLSIGFTIWVMGLQYTDYALDNHRLGFDKVRIHMTPHRALVAGFGSAVLVTTLIPIVNLVVIPAAVAGGTAMIVDLLADDTKR